MTRRCAFGASKQSNCSPHQSDAPATTQTNAGMEAALKLDGTHRPYRFSRTDSRASAGVPPPSQAWVKSTHPPTASNGSVDWGTRARGAPNVGAASAQARSTARSQSGGNGRREAHRPALLRRNDRDERLGLFLAGALLAVFAWAARSAAPYTATVIVAMFAAAFMTAALVGLGRRWRSSRAGPVIDAMPSHGRRADAAFRGIFATDGARPPASANGASPSPGTLRRPCGRSAYAGLADQAWTQRSGRPRIIGEQRGH